MLSVGKVNEAFEIYRGMTLKQAQVKFLLAFPVSFNVNFYISG